MTGDISAVAVGRRTLLAGAAVALLLGVAPNGAALAEDISGELVIMQWQGGVEAELWKKLEDAFMAKHPGVTVRELVVTGQGDMRGPMRTALMGGEVVDVIINTWPAFRAELIDAACCVRSMRQWDAIRLGRPPQTSRGATSGRSTVTPMA